MRRYAMAVLVAWGAGSGLACGAKARPPVPAPAAPVAAAPAPAAPKPDPSDPAPWPFGMRVIIWTPAGMAQIGELPWSPPAQPPSMPWFVEPTGVVDQPKLAQIVAAMRSERIPGLSLRGQPIAPWLGELRDLPDLRALVLDDTGADGAAVAALDLALTRLYLARTLVDDAGAAAIAARQPALEVLDLEDTGAGDVAAKAIARLGELRALNLAGTRLTDAGGAALGALTKLEIADLGQTKVGAKTIAALRPLAIRELFLGGTHAGKEIATLAVLAPGIRRFDVSGLATYKPTDADVAWLANAPELTELGLSGSRVTDRLVVQLVKLPALTRLRLAATPITLVGIAAIAGRSASGDPARPADLEELDLAGTPVDDANAALLIEAPRMRLLRLDATPITDAALAAAHPAAGLSELYLSRTKVTDAGLALLDELPYLGGLGLGETAIGAQTLARIGKHRQLRTLVLSAVNVPEESLQVLGELPELQNLYLENTRAGDATLAALAPLRYLRVLHLANSNVSEASLPALRGFRLLEELTIGDTRMQAGIARLDAWPRLQTLSLLGLELGDAALPLLAKGASLTELDLSNTEVRDPAPLEALPNLRVLGLVGAKLTRSGAESAKRLAARGVKLVR